MITVIYHAVYAYFLKKQMLNWYKQNKDLPDWDKRRKFKERFYPSFETLKRTSVFLAMAETIFVLLYFTLILHRS